MVCNGLLIISLNKEWHPDTVIKTGTGQTCMDITGWICPHSELDGHKDVCGLAYTYSLQLSPYPPLCQCLSQLHLYNLLCVCRCEPQRVLAKVLDAAGKTPDFTVRWECAAAAYDEGIRMASSTAGKLQREGFK